MNFWENIGETITTKGKEVADKAKNLTDIASLKGQIATCESTIQKNYKDIGREYFESHKNDEESEYEAQFFAIKNAMTAIEELKKKINEIKGTRHCNHCNEDVPANSIFCPKCGVKLEDEFFDEDEEDSSLANLIVEEDILSEEIPQ